MTFLKDNAPAIATGIRTAAKFFGPGTVDELDIETVLAINLWYLMQPQVKAEAFPDARTGDRVLSDQFKIDGWGRVWFQRSFWITHSSTGTASRWINGRTAPMG